MAALGKRRQHKFRRRADMPILGGTRPPIALLSAALAGIATFVALGTGLDAPVAVPEAVLSAEEYAAQDMAVSVRASLKEDAATLQRAAGLFSTSPVGSADTFLGQLSSSYRKWRGLAVVDTRTGHLEALYGESIPAGAFDLSPRGGVPAPRVTLTDTGEARLLAFAPLSRSGAPTKMLVASGGLHLAGTSASRASAIVDRAGRILTLASPVAGDGGAVPAADRAGQLAVCARTVMAAVAAGGRPAGDRSGGFQGASGSTVSGCRDGRVILGYAQVSLPGDGPSAVHSPADLTLVSVVPVPERPAPPAAFPRRTAAGSLAAAGVLAVTVLIATVQRPLLRLFVDSRRVGRGDLEEPVRVRGFGEPRRIGIALERLRVQLHGQHTSPRPPPTRRKQPPRVGLRAVTAVCTLLLCVVPLFLWYAGTRPIEYVPPAVVAEQSTRTDMLAVRVQNVLDQGQADLALLASSLKDVKDPDRATAVLEVALAQHSRYRSLYLVAAGRVVARAGVAPLAREMPAPDSLRPSAVLFDGRRPVAVDRVAVPSGSGVLVVGEWPVNSLDSILRRPGLGEIRIVDDTLRVIAGNTGYVGLGELPDDLGDALSTHRERSPDRSRQPVSGFYQGRRGIFATAALARRRQQPLSDWTVVAWQPARGLAIPQAQAQNRILLAGMLALTAVALCLGWLHIIVVRPLRALSHRAEALASGDLSPSLKAVYDDELGAVARSLELVRQRLAPAPPLPTDSTTVQTR